MRGLDNTEASRMGMMAKRISKICFFLLLALFSSGCMNTGIEWSELSFTRNKPNQSDLLGSWVPTAATIKELRERGGYIVSKHELIFRADGTFAMVNMPDWWKDGVGQSRGSFESGSGRWRFYKDHNPWTVWAVELDFPRFVIPNAIHLQGQKPPYLIHITVGDPDSGHYMLFEKEPDPTQRSNQSRMGLRESPHAFSGMALTTRARLHKLAS